MERAFCSARCFFASRLMKVVAVTVEHHNGAAQTRSSETTTQRFIFRVSVEAAEMC